MTNEEVVRLIRLVEAEVPVDEWIIDGVHVWPLFRAQLRPDNFFVYRRVDGGERAPASRPARLLPRLRLGPLPTMARNAIGYARARVRDRAADDRLRPVDALLYSDGVSFVRLDGRYFDRLCDPIRERVEARGQRALMVTPLGRYLEPRHAPSVFVQPLLDLAQLRGAIGGRLRRPRDVRLPGYADALRIARAAFPSVVLASEAQLALGAAYVQAFEAAHERMLDRTKPRVVFIVSYYGSEAMALIRACRRRGIATVDVQHGCINEAHWAYAHWSRVPADGFDLLPRWFWVWGDAEAATIRAWSDATGGAHDALVAGNLFLARWREGGGVVRTIDDRVDGLLRGTPPGARHVMYTLNGYETEAELLVLRDAIAGSKDRLFWWVRPHPAAARSRAAVTRALASCDGSYRIEGDLPLYALLRRMDAHVTEASTTVIEAAELGVPTVLLSRAESRMYADLVERGWAVVLGEGEDLASVVVARIGSRGRPAASSGGPDPFEVLLGSGAAG